MDPFIFFLFFSLTSMIFIGVSYYLIIKIAKMSFIIKLNEMDSFDCTKYCKICEIVSEFDASKINQFLKDSVQLNIIIFILKKFYFKKILFFSCWKV